MRERPRRRRRTATECPGDEVCSLTPDAYRVAMLIALSKGPRNPLTEAQRAEVELFMARLLAKAAAEDGCGAPDGRSPHDAPPTAPVHPPATCRVVARADRCSGCSPVRYVTV